MACYLASWDSAARLSSPSWRQNASKKIDVAWQFSAAVIEYLFEPHIAEFLINSNFHIGHQ